jgi:hypothetical protein
MVSLLSHGTAAPVNFYLGQTLLKGMVGVTGLEPVTPSMSPKCSTTELYARKILSAANFCQAAAIYPVTCGKAATPSSRFYNQVRLGVQVVLRK